MEMNDILNGLNSCDDNCCDSMSNSCSCGPNFGGGFPMGCNFGQGFGNSCGCGFGSWIWILLILFYCGCGRNNRRNTCCCEREEDCCCNRGNYGGVLSNCSPYLFILVILFLCNNNFNGCGNGIVNPCNSCVTSC